MAQISKTIASKKEVISIFNDPAFTQRIVDNVFQKVVVYVHNKLILALNDVLVS